MSRKGADSWSMSAAVYVRMATEHQQYSTKKQLEVIGEYAKRRGLEIVREHSDEGEGGPGSKGPAAE
jgi:DNA invertase Pin-like site-specific DNA recombinase